MKQNHDLPVRLAKACATGCCDQNSHVQQLISHIQIQPVAISPPHDKLTPSGGSLKMPTHHPFHILDDAILRIHDENAVVELEQLAFYA